jgi:hypothetical protein
VLYARAKTAILLLSRYDGPYKTLSTNERHSTVTLELHNNPQAFPVFHTSEVQPLHENDDALFPDRGLKPPDQVIIDGEREFSIDKTVTVYERRRHGKTQYRVRWQRGGPKGDIWLPASELEDCDIWQAQKLKIPRLVLRS